jgi:crotonobetainyl-CoA:carnitine CoA-transferase CaiB-like acyl-CoA transferase
MAGGLYTAIGVLAALVERGVSGKGQYVDVSMLDAQVALLENAFARYFASGEVPERQGTSHPLITPFQAFPTADGYLVVAASPQTHWWALCRVLGRDDLKDDPRFAERAARTRHRAELVPILGAIFCERPTAVWVDLLGAAGVPCGPVNDLPAALADPHTRARELIAETGHPRFGTVRQVGAIAKVGEQPPAYRRAPLPGEDAAALLGGLLGYDDGKVRDLTAAGAFGAARDPAAEPPPTAQPHVQEEQRP